MKIYLIRHAETVDNVAGLYAGVRDSKLTVHGTEQASRLGEYFAKIPIKFSHIFSSPLQRTVKTAEAIQKAQSAAASASVTDGNDDAARAADIVKVPELIEQDFGYYEGKSFHARTDAKKLGRESDADKRRHEEGFVDVESRESMCKRADIFLDDHLLPLFDLDESDAGELFVAVVSHGMLLANLWRRLLLRLPRKSLTVAPEVTAARGALVLEHLGGWSNTGYLELTIRKKDQGAPNMDGTDGRDTTSPSKSPGQPSETSPRQLTSWYTVIVAIDSKQHLSGLKRQRGGIGRLAHDEGQRKLDGFFTKRQKLG